LCSTATVRRAQEQIKALFGRGTAIFPPRGIDEGDNFFATVDHTKPGRTYLGVAAPGRALRAVSVRTYTTLLAAAQKHFDPKGKPEYGKTGKATESTVLGPFFVEGAPDLPLGASIAKPGTPGEPCAVSGTVKDLKGKPIAGASLDIWEGGADGLYDVQKPEGVNLRARFRSDSEGRFHFKCITPVSYPVPHDGPVGKMLVATGRHPMRPGHLHFVIEAPGCEKLTTHLFTKGDKYLDSDAVFGVKDSLIVNFGRKNAAGESTCRYDFVLKPAGKRK
jgi:hydroxyquinol 1,2-dioxygenase